MMDTGIYTVGHSTHPWSDFLEIIIHFKIKIVVDIRTVPRSRHNPQFNLERLESEFPRHDIEYVHLKELGGLRHANKISVNTGWKNSSFRGFADYMTTPEFMKAIERLIDIMHSGRTVIMCAEAVPWRCHRSLIADSLAFRDIPVVHIISENKVLDHKITPWAKISGDKITYP